MTTKIEQRPTALPSTPRPPSVSKTQATAPVETELKPVSPAAVFGTEAPRTLQPTGRHVARSADPDALWGAPPPRPQRRFDAAAFQRMSPAERKAKVEEMRAQQQQLKHEIQDRVGQLDRKWTYSRLKTRTSSLRDLQGKRPQLTADQAQRLDTALKASEAAEQKVSALAEKAKAFGPDSKKDPAQAAARKQLASELRKARAEQSAAVKAATAVIDEAGLKVDRLANAEQVLDKNAPPPGSGQSLWDKIVSFFDLGWSINAFTYAMTVVDDVMTQIRTQLTESGKADREFEVQLRRQLERLQDRERSDAAAQESRALLLQGMS